MTHTVSSLRRFFLLLFLVLTGGAQCRQNVLPTTNMLIRQRTTKKEWTLIMYMGSLDVLGEYFFHNLTQMLKTIPERKINVIVQCNYLQGRAERFVVKPSALEHIDSLSYSPTQQKEALTSCFEWTAHNYPARHYCLCFWGCGSGSVDMIYNDENKKWGHPKNILAQDTLDKYTQNSGQTCKNDVCGIRGILYNNKQKTCLTNNDIVAALAHIRDNVLRRKLDVMLTDACGMASMHLAEQFAPYVSYFTGTQDNEAADGIPYDFVFQAMAKRYLAPRSLVKAVVSSYKQYHDIAGEKGYYTYAAINCEQFPRFMTEFNTLIEMLMNALAQNPSWAPAVFSQRDYTAVSSLYKDYLDVLDWIELVQDCLSECSGYQKSRWHKEINMQVVKLKQVFTNVVVANSYGHASTDKHGFSFYYPSTDILPEYSMPGTAWGRFMAQSAQFHAAQK